MLLICWINYLLLISVSRCFTKIWLQKKPFRLDYYFQLWVFYVRSTATMEKFSILLDCFLFYRIRIGFSIQQIVANPLAIKWEVQPTQCTPSPTLAGGIQFVLEQQLELSY
jgi:hypothetical protein